MKDTDKKALQRLLQEAGLPDSFPLDSYGYPVPGLLVRHFREHLIYTDPADGKLKHWTQAVLAKRLGVSEVTVRLMETKNKGLDSIERRRVLVELLKIPPALLGLASLVDLVEKVAPSQERRKTGLLLLSSAYTQHMELYQDAFTVYSGLYSQGPAHASAPVLEKWIVQINQDVDNAPSSQKPMLLRLLWEFHALASRVYCDMGRFTHAFHHVNAALQVANVLKNADLQAASLYRSSAVHFVQKNVTLAKVDLEGALLYAKSASAHIRGTILVDAGLAHSLVHSDLASATYAQKLFDEAEKYAGAWIDDGVMNFGAGKYLLRRARALIALERPGKALEYLDEADAHFSPSQRSKTSFVNIARAEASMNLKRPEFEDALYFLVDAFDTSKEIHSDFNIDYINRLYQVLSTSSFATTPQVADLGLALQAWYREH